MSSWSDELDKLKERVENLKKKVNSDADSLKEIGKNIDANLEEIKKYLVASEEVIQREAQEQPKIKASYDELAKSITELEEQIDSLQIQYKELETKTQSIKLKYSAVGVVAGIIATIALWKVLPSVKEWLKCCLEKGAKKNWCLH